MRIYSVHDLDDYEEFYPTQKEAIKAAKDRSMTGEHCYLQVTRMELGPITKPKLIGLLNKKHDADMDYKTVWRWHDPYKTIIDYR